VCPGRGLADLYANPAPTTAEMDRMLRQADRAGTLAGATVRLA